MKIWLNTILQLELSIDDSIMFNSQKNVNLQLNYPALLLNRFAIRLTKLHHKVQYFIRIHPQNTSPKQARINDRQSINLIATATDRGHSA